MKLYLQHIISWYSFQNQSNQMKFNNAYIIQLTVSFSKKMGCTLCHNQNGNQALAMINPNKILNVATLNYCGILKSPFEFYSGKYLRQLQQLSVIFQSLKPKYVNTVGSEPFSWRFGKLDKKIKQTRFCPLYDINVGIIDKKFISKEAFTKIWHNKIEDEQKRIKFQINQEDKQQALQFDLLAFHTLLNFVYKVGEIDQMVGKDSELYQTTYTPFFQQAFLDQKKKLDKFMHGLESNLAEIVFIQQPNDLLIQTLQSALEKYYVKVSPDKDTLIFAKKSKFTTEISKEKLFQKITKEEQALLNWNNHTSILILDNYILISGHLSSQKKINAQNVQTLKNGFLMLKDKFPEFNIISGCDINSFLPSFDNSFHLYPENITQSTVVKKRTSMQVQSNKSEVVSKESKDSILTNLPIIFGQITTISTSVIDFDTFLPLDQHPFDHFLIMVKISIDKI